MREFISRLDPGLLAGLALVILAAVVYAPAWQAGFVWDDEAYITENRNLVGLAGLIRIWTTTAADVSPLSLTTFWLEHALWGLAPGPYHLVNVLTHGACAVALWRLLRFLAVPGAWLGAALWAVHPVEVESVAWVSELKNPESGLFFLLAILFFAKWLQSKKAANYGWALLLAAIAMACKSSTVILPPVLCLCAWWMEGRWRWRNLVVTAPFFLLAVAATAWSAHFMETGIDRLDDLTWQRTWPERLITAGHAVWFYLGKLVWPYPLATVYPKWDLAPGEVHSYLLLAAAVVVGVALWAMRTTRLRACFFVFAYFVLALLPVLGLVENTIFEYALVFDHFQYLASMGPLALIGAGVARLSESAFADRRAWAAVCPAALIAVLGVISWQRTWVYQNTQTYWTDALAKNPQAWIGNYFIGMDLIKADQTAEGVEQIQRALALHPSYVSGHEFLGNALLKLGRTDAAAAQFRQAVDLDPKYADARLNLGGALLLLGKVDDAIVQLREVLKTKPDDFQAHVNLAGALYAKKDFPAAILEYRKALEIAPGNATGQHALDVAIAKKAQVDDIAKYQRAIALNPRDGEGHYQLANLYLNLGDLDAAMTQYRAVLGIEPRNVKAHNNLGVALARSKRPVEAIAEFEQALKLDPKFTDAQRNLDRAKAAPSHGK